ncbi:hypothetical protein NDU88_001918 [Pleurodeles waltl]|uniref:Uncharacterized protein n=1 Tax=Pleurodeles waltl TaxID=8319 RepID=A0AAV7LZY7_PLEWA|nr:hypothetical protein NDU88_001918 [Pleurodeles waltl]
MANAGQARGQGSGARTQIQGAGGTRRHKEGPSKPLIRTAARGTIPIATHHKLPQVALRLAHLQIEAFKKEEKKETKRQDTNNHTSTSSGSLRSYIRHHS